MVSWKLELKLDIEGVSVIETKVDYGMEYKFDDRDNKIILTLTELTIDEFLKYSVDVDDYNVYNIIKPYNVRTITGYDWEIKLGKERPNIKRIFKTIEMTGKRYTGINYPDAMYYDYEDERMHRHYKDWIEFMGYELIHTKEIAIFLKRERNGL